MEMALSKCSEVSLGVPQQILRKLREMAGKNAAVDEQALQSFARRYVRDLQGSSRPWSTIRLADCETQRLQLLAPRKKAGSEPERPQTPAYFVSTATVGFGFRDDTLEDFDQRGIHPVDVRVWPIRWIRLWSSSKCSSDWRRLTGIEVAYDGPFPVCCLGGGDINLGIFAVPEGDYISTVYAYKDKDKGFVGLSFALLKGSQGAPVVYGIGSDSRHPNVTCTRFFSTGRPLAYLFGKSYRSKDKDAANRMLMCVGFAFQCTLPQVPPSSTYGKAEGTPFDDLHLVPDEYIKYPITAVRVRFDGGQITRVQVEYADLAAQPEAHGSEKGTETVFQLDPALEFISGIRFRSDGDKVYAIQFICNTTGRTSGYIGNTGSGKEENLSGYLLAMGGWCERGGDRKLRGLNFYWAQDISIMLTDFVFNSAGNAPARDPEEIHKLGPSTNATGVDQNYNQSVTYTETFTKNLSVSIGVKVGFKVIVECKLPLVGENSTEFYSESTFTFSTNFSWSSSETLTTTCITTVPKNTCVTGTFTIYKSHCQKVPFTAKRYQRIVHQGCATPEMIFLGMEYGTFEGANCTEACAVWDKPTNIPRPAPPPGCASS